MKRAQHGAAWLWSSALAIGCGLFAGSIAIRYAQQIPLDQYSFRQTQTALTAYWLQRDGFSLSYETPVVGPPWSIPFEFPLYQWVVACLSTWTGASLNAAGRLVSFAFLVGCVFPVRTIVKRLGLSPLVFPAFCALMLSSPTYVYWGRAFMIETAALFFCMVAIRWLVDLLLGIEPRRSALLFVVFMTIGVLQKATTGMPILALLAIVFTVHRIQTAGSLRRFWRSREVVLAGLCFGIPSAIGLAWTIHADHVKLLNPFAATALTTQALRGWNLGTMAQRVSPELYGDVLWKEMIEKNCAGWFGIALLSGGMLMRSTAHARTIIGLSLAFGIVPLFIFTNLHIQHSYYQCSNVIFFLFALAIVIGHVATQRIHWRPIAPLLLALLVINNLDVFATDDLWRVEREFTFDNSKEVSLGTIVRSNVPAGHEFVAFDFEWTSSLAYLSERKGFTVADVFTRYDAMRRDPSQFMDRARLGAFVACPSSPRQVEDMLAWSMEDGRRWKIGALEDCYVAVPERHATDDATPLSTRDCDGARSTVTKVDGSDRMALVRLRTPRRSADGYFVNVASSDGGNRRYEMLDMSDPSKDDQPVIYSRLIAVAPGDRLPRIARLRGGRLARCSAITTSVQSSAWGRPGFDVGQEADAGHAEHQ